MIIKTLEDYINLIKNFENDISMNNNTNENYKNIFEVNSNIDNDESITSNKASCCKE